MEIYHQLLRVQSGEESAVLELIDSFAPLLKKYAYPLNYSDAFNDLQLKLLQLIKCIELSDEMYRDDKYFLSYIEKTIYRHYIQLSKKHIRDSKIIPMSALGKESSDNESVHPLLDKLASTTDEYIQIQYDFLYRNLTEYEAKIMILHYIYDYPIKIIATHFSVSSASVSRSKGNAIKKLQRVAAEERRIS